ncbi:substrate-binding domain-containing protein [Nocardioides sp. cx-173]|uniref:sugar ABC transporter substrate-binding protein n=1 Tax=Nocardioides sp. cx-173 TaxID=2898796 RepID=UPI001E2E3FFE|nr:substrate-binding domain-containing protein [Nocardioides sp. cx-173]MCD4526620.1 substrate-binding domain-containing protein [Nocardioides sp. cx-173]UGB40713.1 substrate-binding domain-containing protein [Nocardioides sp. cx-173]
MSSARPKVGRTRARAILATALAGALLAACGSTDGGSGGGGNGSGATDEELKAAQAQIEEWSAPLTAERYPEIAQLEKQVDLKGKTVHLIPLSDGIPVIHAIVVGVQQALDEIGADYKVCDGGAGGQPNPTSWGNCLKAAGDQGADAVMTLFIDYEAVATQFDALADKGIPTLIAGVEEKGMTPKPGVIDFYDNTGRLQEGYASLSVSALAHVGKDVKPLWLRLLDSTATTGSSDAGVEKFKEICKECSVYTADFTTANSQAQLAATVSAALVQHPDANAVIVPVDNFAPLAIQGIQQAGKTGKVEVITGSGSLDALQRIKDGAQVSTLTGPIQYEGWLFTNGLMQLLAGQKVEKVTAALSRDFNESNVEELELKPELALTDDWFSEGQPYIPSFLAAWGVA